MNALIRVLFALALLLVAHPPTYAQETPAQRAQQKQDAAAFAVYLSQLEAAGQYSQLYDLMHPDAKALVPESAVVGWYRNSFAPRGPKQATVTFVLLVPWQWGVTGQVYFDAAELTYTQPFTDGSVDNSTMHLARDSQGQWRWFFGGTWEFVQAQINLYPRAALPAPTPPPSPKPAPSSSGTKVSAPGTTSSKATSVSPEARAAFEQVDSTWDKATTGEGWYETPRMLGFQAPGDTGCGYIAKDVGPFYCFDDKTIYLTPNSWDLAGRDQFLLAVIVAHEWGHHIENLVDQNFPGTITDVSSLNLELGADCLAGVWAVQEFNAGRADLSDLRRAFAKFMDYGDRVGYPLTAEDAHGTGEMRSAAFELGVRMADILYCVSG
jgi:uncharacterized protein